MTTKLKNVSFEFTGAHLAYTSKDQGGAASGLNDPLILKSNNQDVTDYQKEILDDIEEEFTPLLKQHKSNDKDSPSSVEGDTGEETNLTKGNEKLMSDENKDELIKSKDDKIAALEKQLADKAEGELKDSLGKYNFSDLDSVTKVLNGLDEENRDVLIKALDELDARDVEKNVDSGKIEKELGEDGEAEHQEELTVQDRIKKALENKKESK
jgi:hypothetical protein